MLVIQEEEIMERTITTEWVTGGAACDLLKLFELVAAEEGWQPGDALQTPPENARHLALYQSGVLCGGVQLVLPNPGRAMLYHRVWPELELTEARTTAHITILALLRSARGHPMLLWSLCAEIWSLLVAEGMTDVVLEATPGMFARYCRLGFPLQEVGALRPHWGEECVLLKMALREVAGAMLMRARHSRVYHPLIARAIQPPRGRPRPHAIPAPPPLAVGVV